MDLMKAKFLLENLLDRVETVEDGSKQLSGKLTNYELQALQIALTLFDLPKPQGLPTISTVASPQISELPDFKQSMVEVALEVKDQILTFTDSDADNIELDVSVFDLPKPPINTRLCLDFGTAMSKAALVEDDDNDYEEIKVLKLGIPGDQEEISEVMLVSSVFIDDDGLLWFGKSAVEVAKNQPEDSNRQQLDNIKRYLSEEGLNVRVSDMFNPTDIDITYGDLILSYLMYLTWCVNHALEFLDGDYPRNIERRFAMPCLSDPAALEAEQRLRKYLGEAQVLADTFFVTLKDGIPLKKFMAAVHQIRAEKRDYLFVTEKISEPLGVAGSLLGPQTKTDMLAMVVDVGAGTTDFSLYRIKVNPERDINTAFEVQNTACCLTEAGNYLDKLLKNTIIKETGIESDHPSWININWYLEKNIRHQKETLFNEKEVFVKIPELDSEVVINRSDFLNLPQVRAFSENLKFKMIEIMEGISPDFTKWILENPARRLVIVLTGGGASLPMVKELAQGTISVHGLQVPLAPAKSFPAWLEEEHAGLEDDYSRIAVALGGARKKIIQSDGTMSIISRGGTSRPTLGTDFTSSR
jgi:hypothetical protein